MLEGSDLRGFRITRPLKVMDDDAEWLDHRYWHLDIPTVVPLSPKMRWIDPDGRSYVGSWVPGAYPPDDGLIVLDRVSLEKAGFPDVAIHEEPREAELASFVRLAAIVGSSFSKPTKFAATGRRLEWGISPPRSLTLAA